MTERIYFRGLDGLRALAAVGVMTSHSMIALKRFPGHGAHRGLELANQSVIIFFTLSGFLITFLLLQEREQLGRIDLRAFYLRRILRIWPLYFFYIALAMGYHWLADPGGVANAAYVLMFVFFVPNIAFNLGRYMPDTAPLWSIGIEEQFYAVWPLVVRHVKKLERVLVCVIGCLLCLRLALHLGLGGGKHLATSIADSVGYDSMAMGALFAFAYRRRSPRILRIAGSLPVQVGFLAWLALLAANQLGPLSLALTPLTSLLTGLFILGQIESTKNVVSLERPGLRHIGRVSFGVYVYHPLMITLLARITHDRELPAWLLIVMVGLMTVATATISYYVLERPFLQLKHRLARIKTAA